jgi:YesN/AraC family two-component response regulator
MELKYKTMDTYKLKELHIKGMVCRRCISVIKNELEILGAEVLSIELGTALIKYSENKVSAGSIKEALNNNEFELLTDEDAKEIEKIKLILVQIIDDMPIVMKVNLSQILANKMGKEYTSLSKLFSKVEDNTIEKYFIHLKIEKSKELIQNDQLNFTQIAYELGYSSVNYLSNQFKQTIGMSMSEYKKLSVWNRRSLDRIL